jgi:hypothetical protein
MPDARKLAEGLMEVMSALLGVIERETELVRVGKVREAMALEPKKSELSRRYVGTIAHLKNSQSYLSRATPNLPDTCTAITTLFAPCCRSTSPYSPPRMRYPKASCAASTPNCSAATCRTRTPQATSARRRARATSRRWR